MRLDRRRGLVYRIFGSGVLNEVGIVYDVIGRQPGTMLDVGACHGLTLAPFLKHGWTVYAFEPDPSNRAQLVANYPNAIVETRAVTETDGESLPLYTSEVSVGISTLSPFHASHKQANEVETVRLDTFIKEKGIRSVDFLKTDAEGFDLFALRTFPWETHRPKAVVCEFEDNKTCRLGYSANDMAEFLHGKGYSVIVSEWYPVVRYGHATWRQFKHYPTAIPKEAAGNFIAVEPELLTQLERACDKAVRKCRAKATADRMLRLQ